MNEKYNEMISVLQRDVDALKSNAEPISPESGGGGSRRRRKEPKKRQKKIVEGEHTKMTAMMLMIQTTLMVLSIAIRRWTMTAMMMRVLIANSRT